MLKKIFKDKKTRESCAIYRMLAANAKKKHVSFHTPGHKIGKWDVTELSFSDNLSCPRGCIAQAEEDIARILGAKKSFILTDGSTSGVLAMLRAAKAMGLKKLLVLGRAHKSVHNACALMEIEIITKKEELALADGVLCTSPDYYGNVADLKGLRRLCDEGEKLLLVDGAHGGHLHFNKALYAGTYADFWVDGVHKSLPALTQGALVSARTEKQSEHLKKAVDIFRTTSPSYPVMASVEYAVKYPENPTIERSVRAYAKIQPRVIVSGDYTKMRARFGKNAFEADKFLQKQGIYAEFCDGNEICFYLSPATTKGQLRVLKNRLKKAFEKFPYVEIEQDERIPAPVFFDETAVIERVRLQESEGRISAVNCGLFPPCTPLVFRGERITREKIQLLEKADNVFGLSNGEIEVVKNGEKD